MIDNRIIYMLSSLLFLIGLFGVMTRRNIMKMLISVSIIETAVNIFLVALGYIKGAAAPILTGEMPRAAINGSNIADPLPHALVLTAIVIGVGTTALGIAIAIKLYAQHHTLNINRMDGKDEHE